METSLAFVRDVFLYGRLGVRYLANTFGTLRTVIISLECISGLDPPLQTNCPEWEIRLGVRYLANTFGTLRTVIISLERSEEHTSELQSLAYLACRLLL